MARHNAAVDLSDPSQVYRALRQCGLIGPVFACALRDEVAAGLIDRDGDAIQLAAAALPKTFPAAMRRQARDRVIIEIATSMISIEPHLTRHALAMRLVEAGGRRQTRHGLANVGGASGLEVSIRRALAYGAGWPRLRRMDQLLAPVFAV